MKKLSILLLFVFSCLYTTTTQAQDYKSAIGLRLGYPWSISYKQFLNDRGAFEVFGGLRGYTYYRWFNVGALYQHHTPFPNTAGLRWYYGGGASVFFWTYDNDWPGYNASDYSSTSFGIMGVIGLDYKFTNVPFNLSVDWIPTFFVGDGYTTGFGGGYGALAARYTFR